MNEQGGLIVNEVSAVALNIGVVIEDQPDPVELPGIKSSVPHHHATDQVVWEVEIFATVKMQNRLSWVCLGFPLGAILV